MNKFFDIVVDTNTGRPIAGAVVSVRTQPGIGQASTGLATLATDSNGTPTAVAGQVTTGPGGYYEFYAAPGYYTLNFINGGATLKTVTDVRVQGGTGSISVDDYGAIGNGTVDDYAAIVAAQNALVVQGGGSLLFTQGKTYKVGTAIPMKPGVTYKGTGRSAIDLVASAPGAQIISTASGIFTNAATTIVGVKFADLFLYSQSGGGHIFDWSLAGIVAKVEIVGCTMIQANAAKGIINGVAAGGVFSIWMHDCDYQYATANSVSPINFTATTLNSIVLERFWSSCTTGATSGVPSIYFESTNASGPAINCIVRDAVFELPGGGSVKMLSCVESGVENCSVYDLAVTPNNPQFQIGKGSTGPASNNCWLKGVRSKVGTTLKPDCKIDCSVSGQAAFLVSNCSLSYLDGGSATPGIHVIGGDITNFQNIAYTQMAASASGDITFGTSDAGSKAYTIWNGYSGNNQGYLNFYQAGAYKFAFSPTGNFQVGGAIGSPNVTLTNSGGVVANSYVRVPTCTVASLPAAATVGAGSRATVSDANATTFNSTVAGGGANIVPVFSDGAAWKIG